MAKNELMLKRATLVEQMKNFLNERTAEGHLSTSDDEQYSNMEKSLEALNREIERAEKIENLDKALSVPTTAAIKSTPATKLGEKIGRASDEYKKAFIDHIHGKFSNALQEDTASEGGYLVPVEFERQLIEGISKVDPIFGLATKITLGAHEKNVPVVSSNGVATLIGEEGGYSDSDDAFTQVVFKAYKFGRICKASEELIADSAFDIESYLRRSFELSIGKAEAGYFWTGTGTNQPQGVLTGAGTGVTTASTSKITADEIIDLYFSVPEQYRANACFVFNDATMKEIRKLKDSNGQYLWTAGIGNGVPDTLLGKPCYTSENIPVIAAGAKIGVFGDISNYYIGDREGVNFLRLNELYAANGQVGFRGSARSDGHVMNSDAIKALVMKAA